MLSTILDLAGAALIVSAFGVVFGLAGVLLASGGVCLAASWALSRVGK
jgi:hypothetical protein